MLLGWHDTHQQRHAVLRNYPVMGHLRFLLECIRPERRQYFIEGDRDATPFSRQQRSLVYQRAKGESDKRPFATQLDVQAEGYAWINHSMAPTVLPTHDCRVRIGSAGSACTQPYSASVFNISAMSFGLVSAAAVLALNAGARRGGLAHDTGGFSAERFAQQARYPPIKMIEIKLSRGAKPGHGGVLPGPKVTAEIAAARGVPAGVDGVSPAAHSAFSTSLELLQFVERLRQLFGGKPVGFKLCIGHPRECFAVAKAMLDSGLLPDFIVVDGAEGGTGAAPLELTDPVGVPLQEGLLLVHNTLVGLNLRERIRIGCAGKVTSAFDIAQLMAPGSLLAAAQGAGPWPHKVFELFWPVAQASSFRPAASFPESSDAR